MTGQVLTAWLHVTNACNLRCPYCFVNKTSEAMDEETGRAAIDAVLRSALSHGLRGVKLKYAGGEASLSHRLIGVLHAHAKERAAELGLDLSATLLSNGVALHPALIDLLRAERLGLMISLDGVGSVHDAQRPLISGRPSFRKVETTISRLLDLGVRPSLSMTVTGRNAAGLAGAVRFALDRGLMFSLNFFRDNECASDIADLRFEEQAMISAMLEAFGVVEEYLPAWSVLGSVLDRGQLLVPRARACGAGEVSAIM